MTTNHTPGPWLLEDRTVYALNSDSSPVNRFWCQVERGWADRRERTSYEEVEANARLIAALPELLEELQGAANYIDALGGDSRKYRAALAKATGEQA